MATLITSGVDYARFFDDLRAVIRQEVAAAAAAGGGQSAAPEIGGLALAMEVTGLSKATIYKLVSERKIVHSKRGNKLYFERAQLLDYVKSGNREVAQQEGGGRG